ncbi:LysR family transcriptional regulator [Caenimonas sedimenti]|uniref:LysR family transcriptional regulator n=1 Tax=Caenimonas sedimenti TaxID=2596921 RepID=A0A562ZTU6_9BURK|nr:LysR family transcriptional regulator [Caenimonas sedimenti]TWO72029.1 LysR family transcriptional regulator [Caenimonas sedimenti]
MNLRFVEAFYWVATLQSVSRAAEKLFITQSAMSARIASLEEELGTVLLDRRDKQFRLTMAGQRFLKHAGRLLELQREIKLEMGGEVPPGLQVRIGAIESVLHSWLIPWVESLRAEFPALELELSVETTPVLIELVRRGALDIVFTASPANAEGVRTKAMPTMEMTFLGNARLHRKRVYRMSDFAEMDLMTFQRGSHPHLALLDQLKAAGVQPRKVHAISSISAMVQLVQSGFGVATLPLAAAKRLPDTAGLKVLRCEQPLPPLPIHANFRVDPSTTNAERVLKSASAFAAAF